MIDIIPRLHSYGYRRLDLNFCELMNPDNDIDEGYIQTLEDLKSSLGLDYVQSHVPYPRDYLKLVDDEKRASDELIKRAITYSVRLGIPAIVIHPIKGTKEENIRYLEKFIPLVDGTPSRLALENMETVEEIHRAEDLVEIIEALGVENAGICLDTGHAHMLGHDIPAMIETFGEHLIATHIADNHGKSDEHLLPYFGTIDWEAVMKAFRAVGYSGAITYECMLFTRYIHPLMEEDVVKLSLEVAAILESF